VYVWLWGGEVGRVGKLEMEYGIWEGRLILELGLGLHKMGAWVYPLFGVF